MNKPKEFRVVIDGFPMVSDIVRCEPEVDVFGDSIWFGNVVCLSFV